MSLYRTFVPVAVTVVVILAGLAAYLRLDARDRARAHADEIATSELSSPVLRSSAEPSSEVVAVTERPGLAERIDDLEQQLPDKGNNPVVARAEAGIARMDGVLASAGVAVSSRPKSLPGDVQAEIADIKKRLQGLQEIPDP